MFADLSVTFDTFGLLRADWLGTICTTLGLILSMNKRIECWPVWLAGNACWIWYGFNTRQYSVVCLNVAFIVLNAIGFFMWKKSNENKSPL